jgi:hypothetical protein
VFGSGAACICGSADGSGGAVEVKDRDTANVVDVEDAAPWVAALACPAAQSEIRV